MSDSAQNGPIGEHMKSCVIHRFHALKREFHCTSVVCHRWHGNCPLPCRTEAAYSRDISRAASGVGSMIETIGRICGREEWFLPPCDPVLS